MQIAVLGTGMVGETIATKLVQLGHGVALGSRSADHPKGNAWAARHGARCATFADAAEFGELLFNCTNGVASLAALQAAGAERIADKIVIDVANVLPPDPSTTLALGERLQQAFPKARVVKALHTVNCEIMVAPERLTQPHTLFMSGNDATAKQRARELLESFGWRDILDLGDITTARASESYVQLWVTLYKSLGTALFNVHVVR